MVPPTQRPQPVIAFLIVLATVAVTLMLGIRHFIA
jgi:hypothetical protein